MSSLFGFLTKKKKRERAWRRIQAVVESSNRMGVAYGLYVSTAIARDSGSSRNYAGRPMKRSFALSLLSIRSLKALIAPDTLGCAWCTNRPTEC
ncbi:hypothetical protein RO3G_15463 [Rhizopus delemar RA 99-880]|uniref:Uncharacterized protein n=1 Tax=Rhizopus delemar (strain RA 99-880 / ATCC MYA-4621 / FGSC 9543 / NRRL 43880) TaxID=246409 RepID=I1CQM2_RHIO9|nr:hypothetical protein RO3G_15463 [Rhizopus delemar RA 99-880]|eukprot:EIE90752.1 hypothetical protein RO3G_15463 [Rhizopus delemar RA 99-880]